MAVRSEEIEEGIETTATNADGDPCNSYEWSLIFLLIFVLAFVVMGLHLWTLWKRWRGLIGGGDVPRMEED